MQTKLGILILFCLLAASQEVNAQIAEKLQGIDSELPLVFNDLVNNEINNYTRAVSFTHQKSLNEFSLYDSALQALFAKYYLPLELRYASLSLTDFDNTRGYYQGREGVFKLTYRVAKKHGINITNFVDERRDVLKSAEVFCKEISRIYEKTNDWRSAMVIYSSSDVEWQRARISSNDSVGDFWKINNFLESKYHAVYSKLVAAIYFANYYAEHGYEINPTPISTQSVSIDRTVTFDTLGKKLGLDKKVLASLNPNFKKGVIPKTAVTYTIEIPNNKVGLFYELGDSVYGMSPKPLSEVGVSLDGDKVGEQKPAPKKTHATLIYRVKSGDALLLIADIYDVTLSSLKMWNGIRGSRINVNQRLYVKVPISKKAYYLRMNRMTMAQKRAQARRD